MATPIWNANEKRWTLRVTIDGVTKKFTSVKPGLAGKRAVLKKARDFEYGTSVNTKLTVEACWKKYQEDVYHRLGPVGCNNKKLPLFGGLYILPAIGKKRLTSVTKSDYQSILNNAKPHVKHKKTLSHKYVKDLKAILQEFINFCVENDYCEPIKGKLYIPQGLTTKEKVILQPDQLKRLYEPAPEYHYHLCLLMIASTGMRPGEALGLKWTDIKEDGIHIQRSINIHGLITTGKNENARRTIPMTNLVSDILEAQKKATRKLKSEWIFCSPIGKMPSQNSLANTYYRLSRKRDLCGSPYTLRHTFVSMVKNVMPEQMVKMIVGHSEDFQTFETYGHVVDGELKEAATIMDLTFRKLAE